MKKKSYHVITETPTNNMDYSISFMVPVKSSYTWTTKFTNKKKAETHLKYLERCTPPDTIVSLIVVEDIDG